MTAPASLIRRHGDARRLAALAATVRRLEGKSIDDALELLDLMMPAGLAGKSQREAGKENARRHPRQAVAVEALFGSDGWGGQGQEPRVWQAIGASARWRNPQARLLDARPAAARPSAASVVAGDSWLRTCAGASEGGRK